MLALERGEKSSPTRDLVQAAATCSTTQNMESTVPENEPSASSRTTAGGGEITPNISKRIGTPATRPTCRRPVTCFEAWSRSCEST